jgi:small nuclear ribonucleoprotein G
MGSKGPNLRYETRLAKEERRIAPHTSRFYCRSPILPSHCIPHLPHISSLSPHRSYLDKRISLMLNKNRKVSGTLRGYDQFMNIVLGDAVEEIAADSSSNVIGMVVSLPSHFVPGRCKPYAIRPSPPVYPLSFSFLLSPLFVFSTLRCPRR